MGSRSPEADDVELLITAMHEAGHAVLNLAHQLPLYDSRIWLERRMFKPAVGVGETRHQRHGRAFIPNEMLDSFIICDLAGAEAEAVAMYQMSGRSLRVCRAEAAKLSRDGERPAKMLRSSEVSLTPRTAYALTAAEVAARWPAIERVGQALYQRRRLTARDVRRLAA